MYTIFVPSRYYQSYIFTLFYELYFSFLRTHLRMWHHAQCILTNQSGPWTLHLETLEINKKITSEGASDGKHWQDSSQVVTPEINDTSSLLDNDLGHVM